VRDKLNSCLFPDLIRSVSTQSCFANVSPFSLRLSTSVVFLTQQSRLCETHFQPVILEALRARFCLQIVWKLYSVAVKLHSTVQLAIFARGGQKTTSEEIVRVTPNPQQHQSGMPTELLPSPVQLQTQLLPSPQGAT